MSETSFVGLPASAARARAGQEFRQRQAEAEDAGGPQAQEIAAGDAVAESGRTIHCLPPNSRRGSTKRFNQPPRWLVPKYKLSERRRRS